VEWGGAGGLKKGLPGEGGGGGGGWGVGGRGAAYIRLASKM